MMMMMTEKPDEFSPGSGSRLIRIETRTQSEPFIRGFHTFMLSQMQHQGLGRMNMPDACVTVSKLVLVPADQGQARLRVPLSTVSTERRRTAHLRRGSGISSSISLQPRDAGLVVSGTCQRPIRIAPRCLGTCCTKRFLLCFAVSGLWRLGPHTRPIRETLARKARHPHDPIHDIHDAAA
jgi:hypothetical protein